MSKFNWPLGTLPFTFLDKLKISKWLFTENYWSAGKWIASYEKTWSDYTKAPHVIMVSSGSSANELIALRRKWELESSGEWGAKNTVLVPITTWISSVSPWDYVGFKIKFTDIEDNLNMGLSRMSQALDLDASIGTVFYTTLLGHAGDIEAMKAECDKRGVRFLLDNCESSFSETRQQHFCNVATSSTSIFVSHFTTSGTEGGLIFCQKQEEADWYRMMRSHGMTRGMDPKYRNPNVEEMFDFYLMGSNYRSSNLQAYMASLDFHRALKFSDERQNIQNAFFRTLAENIEYGKSSKYSLCHWSTPNAKGFVPLSIPIVSNIAERDESLIDRVKNYCKNNGVQYRQIVGGNLARQTAFKKFNLNPKDFYYADWVHRNGIYVGLNQEISVDMAIKLAQDLTKL